MPRSEERDEWPRGFLSDSQQARVAFSIEEPRAEARGSSLCKATSTVSFTSRGEASRAKEYGESFLRREGIYLSSKGGDIISVLRDISRLQR
jgi:hypothetical protein